MSDVAPRLRRLVDERAGGRCEYCRLAQEGLRVSLFYAGKTVRNEPEGIR